jgi:uncharacterized protein
MSPAAATQLNDRLRVYEEQTKHQLIVWIGTTTGGEPIEDWANRAFESWKVGRKGIDDGMVLFIMSSDRKLRFEIGYGLEGEVPDALAGRVINNIMVPRIQAGDNDGAVIAGVEAIAAAIGAPGLPGGSQSRAPTTFRGRRVFTLGQLVFFGFIGIVLLLLLIKNPSLAILLLANQSGRRYRRGGWGGGGGWSGGSWGGGGGGGFGGGGFSGGGGHSGGGGASGSW